MEFDVLLLLFELFELLLLEFEVLEELLEELLVLSGRLSVPSDLPVPPPSEPIISSLVLTAVIDSTERRRPELEFVPKAFSCFFISKVVLLM